MNTDWQPQTDNYLPAFYHQHTLKLFLPNIHKYYHVFRATIRSVIHAINYMPLTFRGAMVLILSLFALFYFGLRNGDITATICGASGLAYLALIFTVSLAYYLSLRKRLKLSSQFAAEHTHTNDPISLLYYLKDSLLAPLLTLEIRPIFEFQHFTKAPVLSQLAQRRSGNSWRGQGRLDDGRLGDGVILVQHSLLPSSVALKSTLSFPHRGNWKIERIILKLGDSLDLISWRLSIPSSTSVSVIPHPLPIPPLALPHSSFRSGEHTPEKMTRDGDCFDIKPYAHGDNTKRILWKAYARSSSLVVRTPETSHSPEGQVALYLLATKQEEFVARVTCSIISQLLARENSVLILTDGPVSQQSFDFLNDYNSVMLASINNIWHPSLGTAQDAPPILAELCKRHRHIEQLLVVGPKSRQEEWSPIITSAVTNNGLKAEIFVVEELENGKCCVSQPQ